MGQRVVLVPLELPADPGAAADLRSNEARAADASFDERADAAPGDSIFNAGPSLAIRHNLANDNLSRGTVFEVGVFTEAPAFAPGFSSPPSLLLPAGLQAPRVVDVLREVDTASNGADAQVQNEPDLDAETTFLAPFAAHDGVFARLGADSGYHFELANMATRAGPVLGLESRPQPTSVQATAIVQHANDDANPQDTDAKYAGGTFAAPSAAVMLSMTKSGLAGTTDELLRWSAASTALDTSTFAGDHDGPALERAFFAAASHPFLAQPFVSRGALLLAGALSDVETPWQFVETPWRLSSALPQVPRLSIDAEKLGQALDAVLADIDELGDSIANSLTDGNRFYLSLAAGGVACYVAGRRLQSDTAAAARAQRGKRVQARRHSRGWLPLRHPDAR